MAEEIVFDVGRPFLHISDFRDLDLNLSYSIPLCIWHSSTSTYVHKFRSNHTNIVRRCTVYCTD